MGKEVNANNISIFWEVTSRCNLTCKHCYANSEKTCLQDLELEYIDRVIQQIIDYKPQFVDISGGEALLRKDIFYILNKLVQAGLMIHLVTNGIEANSIDELKKCNIKRLQISLDGFQDAHEKIRGPNSYDRTIANLKRYVDVGFDVAVALLITPYNINEIVNFARFVKQLGAKKFTAMRFVPLGRGAVHSELQVGPEDLKILYQQLRQAQQELGVDFLPIDWAFKCFSNETFDDPSGCEIGQRHIGIKANGDISVCPFLPHTFGNIRTDNLKDAWDSIELKKLVADLDKSLLQGKCTTCPDNIKQKCGGGCRAIAYHLYGDIHYPDPRCWR